MARPRAKMHAGGTGEQVMDQESMTVPLHNTNARETEVNRYQHLINVQNKQQDQYMSQSDYESSENYRNNNFELNSNVDVNMLPNHGYTSGFTDVINHGRSLNKKKVDDESKIIVGIQEIKHSSKSSSKNSGGIKTKSQHSRKKTSLVVQDDITSQSEFDSSNYIKNSCRVINRKMRHGYSSKLSQSSGSQIGPARCPSPRVPKIKPENKNYDPLNPMMPGIGKE